jgi:hypothetical protein
MARTRSAELGPAARPVAVPDDLDASYLAKASGLVELPLHIRWSYPPVVYDMDDPADVIRVYEQVLREGTEDDVRYYIRPKVLASVWRQLVLPLHVRKAWVTWFQTHAT